MMTTATTKKYIGKGLCAMTADTETTNSSLNVINVLRSIAEDTDSTIYIPKNGYYLAEAKSTEVSPLFQEVTDLISNQERFNFSVRCKSMADGKRFWRTYNIIKDGALHVDSVYARVSEDLYNTLKSCSLISGDTEYIPNNVYKVDLTALPVVSHNWARPMNLKLYEMMLEDIEISAELKILRKIAKEYAMDLPQEEKVVEDVVEEEKEDNRPTKEVDCVKYELKGAKATGDYDYDVLAAQYPTLEDVNKRIKALKKTQQYDRFMSRAIIFAMETYGKKEMGWSEEKDLPRSKGKKFAETKVTVKGNEYTLRKVMFKKEVVDTAC